MMKRRLCLLVLLALAGCEQESARVDRAVAWSTEGGARTDIDTQLKINQEALYRGATEAIRVDAALIMLFSDRPVARQILIDALTQSENKPARVAVCRALVISRETRRQVKTKKDFIKPLAEVLKTEEGGAARAAAEAALLFDYDEIADVLERMAKDATLPVTARLNAIYALKVQMNIRAITQIVQLAGDKNTKVASAARETLRSMGIGGPRDTRSLEQIVAELRNRGMERFQRDWMVQQEARVSELERERDLWRQLYLGSLNKIYDSLGDEGQRGKLLTEQLANPEAAVRLWALDKVSQWRIGTQSKLPAELGPVLVKLISDSNRDVRLATAKLLSLTGELGSAERLAEQFTMELDEEVKLELFVALGSACHYALVPTSGIQLSPVLRKRVLDWAAVYLQQDEPQMAQRGAEVMRKLLETGGLEVDEAGRYLDNLAERYKQEKGTSNDGTLRGELLRTMARLCGQSAYMAEAGSRFGPLFEQALRDDADLVREAAVDGLINIDKAKALKLLAKDFANDRSQIIKRRVMELAGEVGGKDDLPWLWEKVGVNSESKLAWQAMMKIFSSCDVNAIEFWLEKIDSQVAIEKLGDEQRISFLEAAERKAASENRPIIKRRVQENLVQLYIKTAQFERAAEILGRLRESAKTPAQKEAVLGQLMDVYLRWPKLEAAVLLVGNCLLEKDLGADSEVVRSIDAFWDNPSGGADPKATLELLRKIKPAEQRPKWEQQVGRWLNRFNMTANPETGVMWKD